MNANLENRFYDLLSRKLSGEINKEELAELSEIISHEPGLHFLYDQMVKPEPVISDEIDTETAYLSHYVKMLYAKEHVHPPAEVKIPAVKKHQRRVVAAVALFILTAVGIGVFVWQKKNSAIAATTETATANNSKSVVRLPDGTLVHLNKNSKLKYNADFNKAGREVTLIGEGYFDVAHNPEVPFIVHTSEADIKVLGTVFNIRDYPLEKEVETSLLKGSIELSFLNDASRKIVLKPREKLVIIRKETINGKREQDKLPDFKLTAINVADTLVAETSWLNNKLVFRDQPLAEIAAVLEKNFGTKVIIQDANKANYIYTGVFDDTDTEGVLDVLQMIKPFRYKKTGNEIIIY